MGCPMWATCTRIWCVRPVSGAQHSRLHDLRASPAELMLCQASHLSPIHCTDDEGSGLHQSHMCKFPILLAEI